MRDPGPARGEAAEPRGGDATEVPNPDVDVVCKLGGSLVDGGHAPAVLEVLVAAAADRRILVVPGGGEEADRVRADYLRQEAMTEREAHWKALRALDRVGDRIAGMAGGAPLTVVRDLQALATALRDRGIVVLAPHDPLRRAESADAADAAAGRDAPLPHTWRVTSDSVAAWFALRLRAPRLLLLKARDGLPGPAASERVAGGERRSAGRVAAAGIVDPHLPELLAAAPLEGRIVNGRYPARVARVLGEEAGAISTELV